MLIGGKVLIERERLVERYDSHQIRRMHLLVDVVAGCVLRPFQVFRLHRGNVEEHHDQAMVAQLLRGTLAVHAAHNRVGRFAVDCGLIEWRGLVDTLKIEANDLLRLAILHDLKIAGGQTANHLSSLLIADHNVGEHQVAVDLHGVRGLRILLGRVLVLRRDRRGSQNR